MPEEREIKLDVPDDFVLPGLDGTAGLHAGDPRVHVLDATYWDTDALDLMRGGFGLRHRTSDAAAGLWTLKAGSHREDDAMVREEVELPGDAGSPPSQLLDAVVAVAQPDALHPVARLRTMRRIVDLDAAGIPWAEVADDDVTVLDGDRIVHRFREVEIELHASGDAARVEAVLTRLRGAGAGAPTSSSKYVRALRALGYDVGTPSAF